MLIGEHDVATLYKRKIQALGVEVSELKTHSSPTTLEFAKR